MSNLEQELLGTVPFAEAAEWYINIRRPVEKTAAPSVRRLTLATKVKKPSFGTKVPQSTSARAPEPLHWSDRIPPGLNPKGLPGVNAGQSMAAKPAAGGARAPEALHWVDKKHGGNKLPGAPVLNRVSEAPFVRTKQPGAGIRSPRPAWSKPATLNKTSADVAFMRAFAKLASTGEIPSIASPSPLTETIPRNYLAAEVLGRQAQEATEAAYYQEQAANASAAATSMQQQMSELQTQLQQVQAQAQQSSAQIEQSTQQALHAQDEALKQTQVAANMRMGMQKLRAMMLDVASQDPSDVAAKELQHQQLQQAQAQPAQDPNAGQPQAALPETADGNEAQHKAANDYTAALGMVTRQRAAMGIGGVLGAGLSMLDARRELMAPPVQLPQADGTYATAQRIAAATAVEAQREAARTDPRTHYIKSGLRGAMLGALAGPRAQDLYSLGKASLTANRVARAERLRVQRLIDIAKANVTG